MAKSVVSLLIGSAVALAALCWLQSARRSAGLAAEAQRSSKKTFAPARSQMTVAAPAAATAPSAAPDLLALLEQISADPDQDKRDATLQQFADSVAIRDIASMLDALGQESYGEIDELRARLIRRWAETNPAAAEQWSLGQPEGPLRKTALEQVALADAARDLSQAASWVLGLPNGKAEQAAKIAVGYEVARADPVEALDLASTLPPTPQRDDLLVHAASQWSINDFSNAVSWALRITEPQLRERVVSAVAVGSAKQDPGAAATLVAQAIPPGQQQDRAVVSIVQRWAEQSPLDTADWVAQFPQTPMRQAAMQQLLSAWLAEDPSAAQTWIEQLPDTNLRQLGLSAYQQALASRSPATSGTATTVPD